MKNGIVIEICAGSVSDCIAALGVSETDRIELNCALEAGGLTPSLSTFRAARALTAKKIICMVRPRQAGFVYNKTEKKTMFDDASVFLSQGADGIVFGSLNEDHTIDEKFVCKMTYLIHAYGAEAVFHKAFDETPDPFEACETLIRCGADRILTSGQQPDTLSGAPLIRELISRFNGRISILPGGGITKGNVREIIEKTGTAQIHMTAKKQMQDNGTYYAVSEENIRDILAEL